MIFVTGDTHRRMDIQKLEPDCFTEQALLTRDDYVIIAGDFGGIWTGDSDDDEVLDYHENKSYTTLFVAGNHENYDALNKYPVIEWNGGRVHKIRDHVFHLMNGQIFNLEGKTFFIMGGATSVDKIYRVEHKTWWAQEEPGALDYSAAFNNLSKYGNKVDYIITHTVPEKVRKTAFAPMKDFIDYDSAVERFLDMIIDEVKYKKWYAGHIHIDREITDWNIRILYNSVVIV